MPSKRTFLFLAIPLLAVAVAGAAFAYQKYRSTADQSELAQARYTAYAAFVPSQATLSNPRTPPAGQQEYHNLTYGFSLFYPDDLSLATKYGADNPGGVTLGFDDPTGDKGFQIYITPYSGTEISRVEFVADDPSRVMLLPTDIYIDGVKATMFFSPDAVLGPTREVWFIRGGYLFEVTTYKDQDQWLAAIMSTWQWLPTASSTLATSTAQ